jgi:hypothetical protein
MRLSTIFAVTTFLFAGLSAAAPLDAYNPSNDLVSREEFSDLSVPELCIITSSFLTSYLQVYAWNLAVDP